MESARPGAFGQLLRDLRERASLSQEELAERANLTGKAVGALERGERRRPYPNTVRALAEALGLEGDQVRALSEAARPPAREPAGPAADSSDRVPIPSTPMVGRGREVEGVLEMLRPGGARVVTVTGPGGVGKTRLAWEVAARLAAEDRRLVVVELAPVRRVDLAPPTIARAFGIPSGSRDDIGSIAAVVGDGTHVLVLDNVEHLVGIADDIATLIDRCPGVVVLATGRAPLRIRSEYEMPLGPLEVPHASGLDALAESPAAQMFVERARSVAPDFVVDQSNASAVANICRRLDGLPLALELAAAHVQYLGPSLLLDRLDHAVGSARLRDLPARQQTIRATLDWSHDLLTSDEQHLLRSLSVFAGGFDIEAAQRVADPSGTDVVPALEGLLEQSLVVGPDLADPDGAARFRLLEPVRHDAAGRVPADEVGDLADRHAAHFVALGDHALDGLRGIEQASWLVRLDRDHANLRGALARLLDQGRHHEAARLGRSTWLYWALRGHAGEGIRWWERLVGSDAWSTLDDEARAGAQLTLAGLRLATGEIDAVVEHSAAAVRQARSTDDAALLAEALVLACTGTAFAGDLPRAAELLGDLREACAASENEWIEAHRLVVEAQVALLRSDLESAVRWLDAAEDLARRAAGPFTLGTVLNLRTTIAQNVGDDRSALANATEAANVAADVGTTWTWVYTLAALGTQAARRGRPDLAAALFSAVRTTADSSSLEVSFGPDADNVDAYLAEARHRLGEEAFARAWAQGPALAIGDVLGMIPEISACPAPS